MGMKFFANAWQKSKRRENSDSWYPGFDIDWGLAMGILPVSSGMGLKF